MQTTSLYYAIRHLIVSILLGGASAYFVLGSVAYLFLVMSVACVYMVIGVVVALFGSHIKQILFPNARNQSASSLATRTGRTDSQKPGSVSSARRSGRYKGRNDDSKFTGSYPVKMGTGPFSRWKRMEISYFAQQELMIFATEARHPALVLFPRHTHVHALAKSLVIQLTPMPPAEQAPAAAGTTPAPKPAPPLVPVPSRVQIQMFHADDLAAWRSKLPGVQLARTARTTSAAGVWGSLRAALRPRPTVPESEVEILGHSSTSSTRSSAVGGAGGCGGVSALVASSAMHAPETTLGRISIVASVVTGPRSAGSGTQARLAAPLEEAAEAELEEEVDGVPSALRSGTRTPTGDSPSGGET
ncbi:hypothetical protein AMAG_18109 [Allomyces macrogynus ATCC 38327]|uniref:Uncharacterized protein n=1 Tax=Allomyces macrogynus (strain ATCC 38327) TaxID=578462 RepID=A0A0L0S9T1_ALLM3|nr:hypothetical protein AMAG_18109 [Allomyces macrogynus ATCC 38327]|eukprot:KNE59150.1 hypothetical protein AMAG_18109 [Allomyces macrogynus ATCC 38327]